MGFALPRHPANEAMKGLRATRPHATTAMQVGQAKLASLQRVSSQYIYTTYKLSRRHPPDKQVLTDISLSFMPGAKIGVLGYNGAGKSTLLRIMAGRDQEFDGQAQLAPNATVGLLEQEPELDPNKDVRGNVEDGVRRDQGAARPLQRTGDELLR